MVSPLRHPWCCALLYTPKVMEAAGCRLKKGELARKVCFMFYVQVHLCCCVFAWLAYLVKGQSSNPNKRLCMIAGKHLYPQLLFFACQSVEGHVLLLTLILCLHK